ncbi:hypothetical protein ABL78_8404 [Leptomonas seymouri]|uniref:Uncharacterized protein n=1 Tax=Leptomonas seymouri TaxID=5684 RepID=A0A0N0P264_LEPSE|nr:hypothetical protein ABL78_8404 [Leptomonas seymouri]|eukprot:KPI82586.1 hypothetical protein ABL78_8404 [Leptomonas seymouri]
MLSRLTEPCAIPRRCRYASAETMPCIKLAAVTGLMRAYRLMTCRSVPPELYSHTRVTPPSADIEYPRGTSRLGCCSWICPLYIVCSTDFCRGVAPTTGVALRSSSDIGPGGASRMALATTGGTSRKG